MSAPANAVNAGDVAAIVAAVVAKSLGARGIGAEVIAAVAREAADLVERLGRGDRLDAILGDLDRASPPDLEAVKARVLAAVFSR